MEEIQNITKERTAFVVPNAIGIHTDTHKVSVAGTHSSETGSQWNLQSQI